MGYTVILPDEQDFKPPSWRPEEKERAIVELPLYANLVHSRANLWRYPPGAQGRRHFQTVQEEVFLVVDGTFTMLLGDPPERFELPARSLVVVEPETVIKVMNDGDEDGLIFVYGAPADRSAEILEE